MRTKRILTENEFNNLTEYQKRSYNEASKLAVEIGKFKDVILYGEFTPGEEKDHYERPLIIIKGIVDIEVFAYSGDNEKIFTIREHTCKMKNISSYDIEKARDEIGQPKRMFKVTKGAVERWTTFYENLYYALDQINQANKEKQERSWIATIQRLENLGVTLKEHSKDHYYGSTPDKKFNIKVEVLKDRIYTKVELDYSAKNLESLEALY